MRYDALGCDLRDEPGICINGAPAPESRFSKHQKDGDAEHYIPELFITRFGDTLLIFSSS